MCSICVDEMSIRNEITWDHSLGRMTGYVTYGCDDVDDPLVAKEAIVYVVSGLNEKFRIPLAYHFVNSRVAGKRVSLVVDVINSLDEIGVKVKTFEPYITVNGRKIPILLDICHAEKLVRGWLNKKSVFFDGNGGPIKW